MEDGPGIRTTIFFKGCPLSCKWCHNPELIDPNQQLIQSPNNCIGCGCCIAVCPEGALSMDPERGIVIDRERCTVCLRCTQECYAHALRPVAKPMTVNEILAVAEQDKGFYDNTGGGITLSGGEVLMHAAFAEALIDEAGRCGISACLDTCGFGSPQALLRLARKENVTTVLYDIKSLDDKVHRRYTGVSNERIIENLRLLARDEVCRPKITVRMPLMEGVNDGPAEIRAVGTLLRKLGIERVDLLPYHTLGISKERNLGGIQQEFRPPTDKAIQRMEDLLGKEFHMQVGVLGKV